MPAKFTPTDAPTEALQTQPRTWEVEPESCKEYLNRIGKGVEAKRRREHAEARARTDHAREDAWWEQVQAEQRTALKAAEIWAKEQADRKAREKAEAAALRACFTPQ